MASNSSGKSLAAVGFANLPATKQIGVLAGLAMSVALGVYVVLWAQKPNLLPLYSGLNARDTSEIADTLQQSGIKYEMAKSGGAIMVQADKVYDARMRVAAAGLPHGTGSGFELLEKEQGFGTSQFMESVRYRHALEGELARTISSFENVASARVHLAIPKHTAFLREQAGATASVFVDVYAGHDLSRNQVGAILHLVASSVPELSSDKVTVVDQLGHLLTDNSNSEDIAVASRQLGYKNQLESALQKKIEDLIIPILGAGKVKARVSADVTFKVNEKTQEQFDPESKVVRSEQVLDVKKNASSEAQGGVPGAASNQPGAQPAESAVVSGDTRMQATRNYELNKVITHSKDEPVKLNRLSVAVVLDDHSQADESTGEVTYTPLTEDEIAKFTKVVKDAIGFSAERGDVVNVINSSFVRAPKVEALPEEGLFQKSWFWTVLKEVAAGLFLILILFGVVKPGIKNLASRASDPMPDMAGPAGAGSAMLPGGGGNMPQITSGNMTFDEKMKAVKGLVNDDPKRVAQVVKNWVDEE